MAKEIIVIIELGLKGIRAWTGPDLRTDIFALCLHNPGFVFKDNIISSLHYNV